MKIVVKNKGNFSKTKKFFNNTIKNFNNIDLERYGIEGVRALQNATPKDTGETANSWSYEIIRSKNSVSIVYNNSNIVNGIPVVILMRYGHATKSGSYISGIDFIDPALKPVFENLANNAWKEVIDT